MKESYKKAINNFRRFPVGIFLILSGVLNYMLGEKISEYNEILADISSYENKDQFMKDVCYILIVLLIVRVFNQIVGKINKHTLNDKNYMRWIKKLSHSSLASISNATTGAISNAITSIAAAEKNLVNTVASVIPNIVPFVMLCVKEYQCAGWLPVAFNVGAITLALLVCWIESKIELFKLSSKARSRIHSVTLDCIKNISTVKYFNKEEWSIDRQENAQLDCYAEMLNLPVVVIDQCIFYTLYVSPVIVGLYLCWGNMATMLYIMMMNYVIDNVGNSICQAAEYYIDRKAQIEILGKLENDEKNKKQSLADELVLSGIEFKYNTDDDDAVLFKIDDICLKTGHRYCITGRSGFGKSTFAKLITGTYAPQKGTVSEIDSVYMFAESEMFNTTIAENISLGEDFNKKEIEDLLKAFEIEVDLDPFTDKVGENGSRLSTGQKQRINLCRTLFYARRHPQALIVMDEVTAALDMKTSLVCLEYLTEQFKDLGITLVYISNKTDYLEVDLITDNIYVHKNEDSKIVTYSTTDTEE